MQTTLRTMLVTLSLFVAFLFAGCGAPAGQMDPNYASMAAPELPAASDAMGAPAAEFADAASYEFTNVNTADRMLIGTANVGLLVADTEAAVDAITALATEAGGYVSDNNFYQINKGEQTLLAGSMTARVPARSLDAMLAKLAALAKDVTSQSLSRQDVTDQYVDIEARLRTLQATETELLALLAEVRAKPGATPEDILAVHRNLMDIRTQIEQIQGQQKLLQDQIAMSTIYITLDPDATMLPIVEAGWRPGATANSALRALVTSMQSLGNTAIWLVIYATPVLLTVLLPVVLVLWGLAWLLRRSRRRRQQSNVA